VIHTLDKNSSGRKKQMVSHRCKDISESKVVSGDLALFLEKFSLLDLFSSWLGLVFFSIIHLETTYSDTFAAPLCPCDMPESDRGRHLQ